MERSRVHINVAKVVARFANRVLARRLILLTVVKNVVAVTKVQHFRPGKPVARFLAVGKSGDSRPKYALLDKSFHGSAVNGQDACSF